MRTNVTQSGPQKILNLSQLYIDSLSFFTKKKTDNKI